MILPAQTIRQLCQGPRPMVSPFAERTRENGVSYGLSSAGYDIRIAETIWVWPLFGRLASVHRALRYPSRSGRGDQGQEHVGAALRACPEHGRRARLARVPHA